MKLTHLKAMLFAGTAWTVMAAGASAQTAAPAGAGSTEAQKANSDQSASPANDSGVAQQEIVVTARRTEESVQRVPIAVSAFNQQALQRIQATDSSSLQGAVPNLNIVPGRGSSNATNIFIRGVGQPDALQTFDPAIGFYVDDVYYSRIRGTQLDLLDIDRVEVLRGPQGTLYGKNTIGGALKVVTRRPDQNLRLDASADVGSYDLLNLRAAVSGPLSSTVAAGISAIHLGHEGYVKDPVLNRRYNDQDTNAVRGAIAFTPSARFKVDLSADWSEDNAAANVGQPLNSLTYLVGGATIISLPTNPTSYDFTGRTTPSLPNSTKLRHWGGAGHVNWELSDKLTLRSITAYRNLHTIDNIDVDATQLQIADAYLNVKQRQFSQEFQLNYVSGPLQAVAGLYYLNEGIKSHQEAKDDNLLGPLLGNPTFLRTIDDDLSTKSYAAYANASYEILQGLRLDAGIRFTDEKKNYFRTTSTFSSFAPLTSKVPFTFSPQHTWHDVSPMVSLDYQIDPKTMVYARVARGFKSGGFNGRANSAAESTTYQPETMISYEAGLKTTIANQLRLNGAIFYNDYKNFQARVAGLETDPVTNLPLPTLGVLNAGKLSMKGAELEASWTPVRGLVLDSQIGYLDAKYKEFADLRFPNGSRAFQEPAFAPKWTLRFGAQYEADLGHTGWLTFGGQARYRSRMALSVDNTYILYPATAPGGIGTTTEVEGLFQNPYWVADARIVWQDPRRHYSLGLYVQNLGDTHYKTDAQEFSSIGSIRTVYYGAPRTWYIRAGVHF